MDRLIKVALKERASEVTVPPDAWEGQKALLLALGLEEGKVVHRPWWQRWAAMAEVGAVAVLLVGLVAAGIIYGPLRPGGGADDKARTVEPPVHDDLNPRVAPPSPRVVIAPDLPALTPPAGSRTQEEIVAAAIALVDKGSRVRGGQLTLSHIALVEGRWELEFRGDGRAFTFSGGPGPRDPRKDAYSHVVPVDRLTYQIDAATGGIHSIGVSGLRLAASRSDLEHYRGFVVSGGEQTTLRLVGANGEREGRNLSVWVVPQALDDTGLALWHLTYGAGRVIDVWGLTVGPGEILAYRVEMRDQPGEQLLAHDVVHGIPLPDGAKGTNAGYVHEGHTVESLKAWYEAQMGRYGWPRGQLKFANGESRVLRFENNAWQYAEVAILPNVGGGVLFTLTWGMTQLGTQDQAVAAVFQSLGDDPAFRQFPRSPGTFSGELNIGGPAPGVTIPATYETRVSRMPDGAWEVELVRAWGNGLATAWGFRVDEDGVVHSLGQSGHLPPAMP